MTIAFIPARCGSKSISFKNIKEFCGKPLIYWSLLELEKSERIDKVFVATDCEQIKDVVVSFNFSKVEVYDREIKNANDTSSTESVMLEFIQKSDFNNDDLFCLVQATSPLTQSSDFTKAFMKFDKDKTDSLLTCTRVKSFFWTEDGIPINYDYKKRPRRQDFDGVLVENGAFYISYVKNIKKYKNRLSERISIYEMDEFKYIDIDEEEDWEMAERIMKKNILKRGK
ncbi:acylneuraminate cytidylyltransferase family protein [bacterium]|jgi:CMP-N-acetylneuraminic acid synthetase|nr:acylneuraminate cytidylyltransferase family protein [bacterium]